MMEACRPDTPHFVPGVRGEDPMHKHSRSCLQGPVSGAREWWRTEETPPAPTEKEPLFRAALVEQIRREIAAGTYDTPEKWEQALDRLQQRLEAEDA
jgi:hypothetical protein